MTTIKDAATRTTAEVVAVWMSVLVSLSTLGLLIWKGGAISQTVFSNTQRLDKLEAVGSGSLQAHERMDDQRELNVERRLQLVENAVTSFGEIRADVREIKVRLNQFEQTKTKP